METFDHHAVAIGAIRLAAEGGLVGMFPEGAINTTDEFMRPVRPGGMSLMRR